MSRRTRPDLATEVLAALPGRQADIARALGRQPSDGTVRRRLAKLVEEGEVVVSDGVFERCRSLPEDAGLEHLPGYAFPPGFDDDARAQFLQQLDRLQSRVDEVDGLDVDLIERYVGALQRARIAQATLDAEGMFTSSARGRRFVHPAAAIVREAERDAQVYMDSLRRRAEADSGRGRPGAADGDEFDNLS